MIQTNVSERLEAMTYFSVIDAGTAQHEIDAVVDTGFNGFCTLDAELIRQFRLKWKHMDSVILADGSIVHCNVFDGWIEWDGRKRRVEVQEANTCPLVGTELLRGHEFKAEFIPGGAVTVRRINEKS